MGRKWGKVVGKLRKVTKFTHTCSHMITQWTEQNTAFNWQQGLAISILYIMYLNSMYQSNFCILIIPNH